MTFVKAIETMRPEEFADFWPFLAAIGFGVEQAREVVAKRQALGLPCDQLRLGLEFADAAVELGGRWAKAAIFDVLVLRGEFARPPGYLTGQERAALDRQRQEANMARDRLETERLRFESWRGRLAPDEVEAIKALGVAHLSTPHVGLASPLLDVLLREEWRRRGKPRDTE